MKNIINSSTPLSYLSSPALASKVTRVDRPRDPLDDAILDSMVSGCRCNTDEVCGFITDSEDVFYIPNSHNVPHCNFYMHIEDIQDALHQICKIKGENVLGVFHTHPNNVPWPTPIDINGWPNLDLGWRYWIATNHEVVEWSKGR